MSKAAVKTVACPTCGAPVRWEPESHYRPFCSERCKLIDLGQWANESYRVPAEEEELNSDELGGQAPKAQ